MTGISTITPATFDSGRSVTLTGEGFGASQGSVLIGGVAQNVNAWSDTSITFTSVRGSQSMGACRVDVVTGGGSSTTISDGVPFTLVGTFTAKTTAAPIYYNNWEGIADGTTAGALGFVTDDGAYHGVIPQITSARAYTGTKSLRADFPVGLNSGFTRTTWGGFSVSEVYCSCNFYWERYVNGTDPGSSLIFKTWRAGKTPSYSSTPHASWSIRPGYTSGVIGASDKSITQSDGEINFNGGDGNLNRDQWNRSEMWLKLSTPGVGNGVLGFYSNLVLDETTSSGSSVAAAPHPQTWNALPTRGSADTGDMIEQVMLPFVGMDNIGTNNAYYVYVDNLYIDSTPIRVEVGNAPSYASCTERVVAPATAWSTTSITASAPTGRWSDGQTVYAFVIGSDNQPYSGPFPLTVRY